MKKLRTEVRVQWQKKLSVCLITKVSNLCFISGFEKLAKAMGVTDTQVKKNVKSNQELTLVLGRQASAYMSLDVELINLGWLPNSKLVANSILTRKPFILNSKADAQLNERLSDIVTNIERVQAFQTNSVRFFD